MSPAADAPLDVWLDYIGRVHPQTIEMGLERVREVAAHLDVLKPARRTLIVAGTNGKGSTCVTAEQVLLQHGLAVGTTLSPHVSVFNERIRINGEHVTDADIVSALHAVDEARRTVQLTYFEFAILAALVCFKRAAVDVAVLEVGLGGRLDATNIVDADVAVITSIGLDHQNFLGDTRELIGAEKAGVLRTGQIVILGEDMPQSVAQACARHDVQPRVLGVDVHVERAEEVRERITPHAVCLDGQPPVRVSGLESASLAPTNLALGIAAACELLNLCGVVTSVSGVRQGAVRAWLPGRVECFKFAGRLVYVDVAHNAEGAAFFMAHLPPGLRVGAAIVGMLADKPVEAVAKALISRTDRWLCVPTHGPRALDAVGLRTRLQQHATVTETCNDAGEALERALVYTNEGDGILVCGSFAIVEEARALLLEATAAGARR